MTRQERLDKIFNRQMKIIWFNIVLIFVLEVYWIYLLLK